MRKKSWHLLILFVIAILVLAACSSGGEEAAEESAPQQPAAEEKEAEAEAEESEEAEEAMAGDGTYLERAMAGEFSGKVVTMMGPFTDEDEVKFNNSVAAFEDETGIDIQYSGTKEFEATISVRVDAGDAPDIVDFPQPGLLANFAADGHIVDVSSFLDESYLQGQYDQSWLDMGTVQGPSGPMMGGVWHRFNGKSLVWYPKDDFEAAGYTIPTTWDEMLALSDLIVDDGDAPWCIGIESGAATGWPATDWMEEVMLRTTSLENYDAWVRGELPFSSPEVKNAAETMAELWFNDDYVLGGRAGIVSTFFGDSPTPMFEDPPKCWFHKQGNFITSFFPAGVEPGVDYDFFYLPSIDDAYGKPFLVAGDIMALFNDTDEAKAVMEFFTKGEALKEWLAAGGALAPHLDVNLDWYSDDIERGVAEIVSQSTSFRFDGSDLMPGEVGAGSFWTGMTGYVSGSTDLDTALAEIDASWPGGAVAVGGTGGDDDQAMDSDSYLARAMAGEFSGTTVTMMGPFVSDDEVKFNSSNEGFEEATGIDIKYTGTKEFEATISVRVDAGDAPDIVDFPQPGLLASFVADGHVVDVSSFMDMDGLQSNYNQSWLDMATMQGPGGPMMAGVWHRAGQKSIIWYPKAQFDAAGYEIPATWAELVALTELIADDGDTAWCIGIESGAATGWVVTDWMENIMLRTTSLENYDKWVTGELPFSSPEVKNAAELMSEIWLNDDYVYGGQAAIVSTFIGDAPVPMFEDPPRCWLHAQASWITSFFGEGLESGVDYDFFYMPPIDEAYGKPVLVAGDIMSAFDDRDEIKAVMEFFSTGASVEGWIKSGGAISPHGDSSLDWYTTDIDREVAKIMLEAGSLRFDASDLMPGEVGAGSFWTGMTGYISGSTDLDTALEEIDASWPQ